MCSREAKEWFETKARREVRSYIGAYLSQITNWDEVELRVGRKGNRKLVDRLRVHRRGTGSGGAVYIGLRGKLLFRVPKETDIDSFPFARARNVHRPHDDYGIDCGSGTTKQ